MLDIGPPKGLFQYVLEFAKSISPNSELFYVEGVVDSNDITRECVKNVERRIEKSGGKSIFGWKIWEWYGIMIEAEFHAVWRSPDGKFLDPTPNEPHVEHILFLPDPALQYEGKQIDNIRKDLNDNSYVREYISTHEQSFELMNRGTRVSEHGNIELSEAEAIEWENIEVKKAQLAIRILNSVPGRNDLCRCGRGRKYKKCCGSARN